MALIGPANFLLHDDVVAAFGRALVEREVIGRFTAAGECPICQVPLAPSIRDGARTLTVVTTVPAGTGTPFAGVVALYAAHLECSPDRGFLMVGASLIAPSTYQYFPASVPIADAPNALLIVVNPSVDQVHLTRMSVDAEWKVLGSIHGLGDRTEGWFKMVGVGGVGMSEEPKMVGTFDVTTGHVRFNGGYTLDVLERAWSDDLQIATVLVSERLAIPSGASGLKDAMRDFMHYGHAGQLKIVGRAPATSAEVPSAPGLDGEHPQAPRRRWWRLGGGGR